MLGTVTLISRAAYWTGLATLDANRPQGRGAGGGGCLDMLGGAGSSGNSRALRPRQTQV